MTNMLVYCIFSRQKLLFVNYYFVKRRTKHCSRAVDDFFTAGHDIRHVHSLCKTSVFMWDMLFTFLPHSSLCTHPLLRFFMRFSYTQLAFEMYPALCRSGSSTLATSLFVTIVKVWLIFNYYHKKLYLIYCRILDPPVLKLEKVFFFTQNWSSLLQNEIDVIFMISHSFSVSHVCFVTKNVLFLAN